MEVTHVFAGVAVSDFAAAYGWYVRLFGRTADMFPLDDEAVWRLTASSSVYVVGDIERAGNGLLTLASGDLNGLANRLQMEGFGFTWESGGNTPVKLMVSDDDGNRIAFFQDPALQAG
ncbi:MAG TPA: hypothetical protein VNC40_03420 [Gaiellaceae bacterium]|nr:hypothetical protein [Gaiellaceae bacterium]